MNQEHTKLRDWFWDEYGEEVIEENYFALEAEITQMIFRQMDSLKAQFVNKLTSNQNQETRNALYKKCPYCGEVWMKVVGCPSTTCGARPGEGFLDKAGNVSDIKNFWNATISYFIQWKDDLFGDEQNNEYEVKSGNDSARKSGEDFQNKD